MKHLKDPATLIAAAAICGTIGNVVYTQKQIAALTANTQGLNAAVNMLASKLGPNFEEIDKLVLISSRFAKETKKTATLLAKQDEQIALLQEELEIVKSNQALIYQLLEQFATGDKPDEKEIASLLRELDVEPDNKRGKKKPAKPVRRPRKPVKAQKEESDEGSDENKSEDDDPLRAAATRRKTTR